MKADAENPRACQTAPDLYRRSGFLAGKIPLQLVLKAKELDLAGATVFHGRMGYGANSRIHSASLIDLSADLPILIEIIDSEEYIQMFLPYLDKMLKEGLVTIDDVDVIKYGRKAPKE